MTANGILYNCIDGVFSRKLLHSVEQYLANPKHQPTDVRIFLGNGGYTVMWIELADNPLAGCYEQEIIIEFDTEDDAWAWVVANQLETIAHSTPIFR